MMRARDDLDVSTQEGMTQYACAVVKSSAGEGPIEMENHLRRLVQQTAMTRVLLGRLAW